VRELSIRLAREGALPAYIYDIRALDAHAARIRAALPAGVEFYYAMKANPDPAVLRTISRHADGLEVSSGGELRYAAAEAPGRPLAFGGPGKTEDELAAAVRAGALLHVESPQELLLLASIVREQSGAARAALEPTRLAEPSEAGANVLLRANLDVHPPAGAGLVMGGTPGPFGMDDELLAECAALITGTGLRLRGLHAHLASGLGVGAALSAAAAVLRFARQWCDRHRVRRPVITLGGGMGADYRRPGATFGWEAYGRGLARLAGSGRALPGETLRIEPGRAVAAYCGWYATRVLDVKRSRGAAFAVVAGGTHHLRTPAAKSHSQPFSVIAVEAWPHSWVRPALAEEPVTITGQLCTPKDILARDVRVRRLRTGDLIAFGMAGAYAWNISHTRFLMHAEPGFHYIGEVD
jgi:diaminopimelate decarboxylase